MDYKCGDMLVDALGGRRVIYEVEDDVVHYNKFSESNRRSSHTMLRKTINTLISKGIWQVLHKLPNCLRLPDGV